MFCALKSWFVKLLKLSVKCNWVKINIQHKIIKNVKYSDVTVMSGVTGVDRTSWCGIVTAAGGRRTEIDPDWPGVGPAGLEPPGWTDCFYLWGDNETRSPLTDCHICSHLTEDASVKTHFSFSFITFWDIYLVFCVSLSETSLWGTTAVYGM